MAVKNFLKSILPYLLLIGLIISCKDDDVVDPMLGTWTLYSQSATDCDNPANNYSYIATCTASECVKITFKSDSTREMQVTEDNLTVTYTGTYTKSGNQITYCQPNGSCNTAAYTIVGNTFTTTYTDTSFGCTNIMVLKK
jgi:hypothetical protein